MAVVNTKATAVTNGDSATPSTNVATKLLTGRLKSSVGVVEVANGDSIGSTLRLAKVHSSHRINRVLISCDAITSAAADIGIYDEARAGGAVVDVDFFGSAVSIATALVHSDVTHEADPADAGAGYGHADVEKPLWQALGLTADPGKWYDLVATLTAAATATGTLVGKVEAVDGN